MAEHEGYESKLKFVTDSEEAEHGIGKLHSKLSWLSGKVHETKHHLKELGKEILGSIAMGAGISLGEGLVGALKHIGESSFEANMELGQMQRQVTGTLIAFQNWDPAVDMLTRVQASMRDSKEVTEELEEAEMKLAIPLNELTGAYSYLGGVAIQKYGASQKESIEFTKGAAAAAKILGMSVTRILETRHLKGIDPVSRLLRSAIGNTKHLQSMKPDKLFALVSEKLAGLGPAAEKMASGFGGTIFRIKAFFEHTIRDIGGPAFEFITKKVSEWGKRLDSVTSGGKKIIEVIGEGVLKAVEGVAWGVEQLASGIMGISEFVQDLGLSDVFHELKTLVKDFWDVFGAGASSSTDLMDVFHGASDALFIIFSAGKITLRETLKFLHEIFEGILTGVNKVLGLFGKAPISAETRQMLKMLNPLSPTGLLNPTGVGALKLMGQVQSKYLGDGSQFGEWGKLYVDRLKRREAMQSPTHGQKMPETPTPETASLLRRGPAVNNFYGDIKINNEFKDANPDDVWVQIKNGLEDAAANRNMSHLHSPFGGRVG